MTRLDLIGTEAVQQLKALAVQFGVAETNTTGAAEDLYGAGIQSISDLPCLSSMPHNPIDYVMEGVIAYGAITLFVGPSGCGKTTLLTAMSGAISQGQPFAGLSTKQAPVLHLDRENGQAVVQERLRRVHVRTSPMYRIWGGWAGNGPPHVDAEILERYVRECNPKPVIIIDSLVAFHPGNENDARETRAYFNVLRRLVSLGAAVILIHHNGKAESAQKYRGSSDIEAAADIAYSVKNNAGTRLDKVQIEPFKARFTVIDELTLQYVDGVFSSTDERILSSADHKLEELLKANPGITGPACELKARDIDVTRTAAHKFLKCNQHVAENGTKNKGFT